MIGVAKVTIHFSNKEYRTILVNSDDIVSIVVEGANGKKVQYTPDINR